MSRGAWWAVVAALLALSGCATGSGDLKREALRFEPSVPETRWKHVRTTHFELWTDLDAGQAERAALLLSQSLAGLTAMFAKAPVAADATVTVIALKDGLQFEERFGRYTWGFAATSPTGATLYLYGPPDKWFVRGELRYEGVHSVLQHELAHAVLRRYFPVQPLWFSEGMAQYLETYRWLDAETLELGDPNLVAYRSYRAYRSLTLQDMLAWQDLNDRQSTVAGLYGLSWAFIHWARNQQPRRLASFLAQLAQHDVAAFEHAFGEDTDAMDKAIYAYLKQGSYQQLVIKVPLGAPEPARVEAVTPEEEAALRARLDGVEQRLKKQHAP
jgi:hypothetical protein